MSVTGGEVELAATPAGAETLASPWARFWAKILDITLWAFCVGFVLDLLFPSFLSGPAFEGRAGVALANIVMLPFVMLLDAVVLAVLETTPGAFCAGFRIQTADRRRVTLPFALRRNLMIYFGGLAAGVPLLSLFTLFSSYRAASANRLTYWDEQLGTRPYSYGSGVYRTVGTAVLVVVVRFGMLIATYQNA